MSQIIEPKSLDFNMVLACENFSNCLSTSSGLLENIFPSNALSWWQYSARTRRRISEMRQDWINIVANTTIMIVTDFIKTHSYDCDTSRHRQCDTKLTMGCKTNVIADAIANVALFSD